MKKIIQSLTVICLYNIATPTTIAMEDSDGGLLVIPNYSSAYTPLEGAVQALDAPWDPDLSPPGASLALLQERRIVEDWASNGTIDNEMVRRAGEFIANIVKADRKQLAVVLHNILRHEGVAVEDCIEIARAIQSEAPQRQDPGDHAHYSLARTLHHIHAFVNERQYGNFVLATTRYLHDWFGVREGWSFGTCDSIARHLIEGDDLPE